MDLIVEKESINFIFDHYSFQVTEHPLRFFLFGCLQALAHWAGYRMAPTASRPMSARKRNSPGPWLSNTADNREEIWPARNILFVNL